VSNSGIKAASPVVPLQLNVPKSGMGNVGPGEPLSCSLAPTLKRERERNKKRPARSLIDPEDIE